MRAVFQWLDAHPQSYWALGGLPTLLLILRCWQAVRAEAATPRRPAASAGWRDGVVLGLFLLAWRWPFLLGAREFNPDESQLIAGALTLARDPVFWRSVDGNTAGPFDFYALLPLHWLGLPLDYFSARLTGLLIIWGTLFICLRTLARLFGPAAAWLGVLPGVTFFATVTHHDFLQYSTEHLPLLVVAGSFGLLATRPPGDRRQLWLACFFAGLLPWTKLQSGPFSLVLVGWAGWKIVREPGAGLRRSLPGLAGMALSATAPTLLIAGVALATGQAESMVRRYFLHNVFYVAKGDPLAEAVAGMAAMARQEASLPLLLATALATLTGSAVFLLVRRARRPGLLLAAGLLTLAAVVAIGAARREFLHYMLLLTVPLTLASGVALGSCWMLLSAARTRLILAGAVLVAAGATPLVTRSRQPPPEVYGHFAEYWRQPRSNVAILVRALAGPDDSLAIWGWASSLYVETALPQATRDAVSQWSIVPNHQRDYHRTVWLADLQRSTPAVFVDAVGPGAFAFEHRGLQAHETFPDLGEYIRATYVLVADTASVRIYARRDLPVLADLGPATVDWLLAQGRIDRPAHPWRPAATAVTALSLKQIDGRPTRKLEPPGLVEWPLDADMREVYLRFGFDPIAYEPGRSNGAGLILELTDGTQIRPLYRRQLDPAREPRDRGLQPVHLILPPFAPGTRLILRTDPGLNGDAAWDWMHFTAPEFGRSPGFRREQFPDFDPVPTAAEAENSAVVATDGQTRLQLPPPAALHFELLGSERRLAFEYGLRPGAYTRGGRTDGAVFAVELGRPGEPPQTLFRRHLEPRTRATDRGPQRLDLALPPLHRGDRLTLRIDAGPAGNSAWDWTYITSLKLH
ncbi:MAG TPA: hypothetical protein VGD97_05005 [Lacunisphaera sp.]